VLDGKEVAPGSGGSKLVFSPGNKQLGCIGYQVKDLPVEPGSPVEHNIDYPVFSSDSQHFTYCIMRQNPSHVQGLDVKFGSLS
jgi:hypothetical protein